MKLTKVQIAVPAAIVLLAALAGGAQLWGQHEAQMRVDETLSALPAGMTGHYERVNYNVFTRTLRLEGLNVTRGGAPVMTIRHLVLHHISGQGTDQTPLRADSVHVTGLDVWHGGHRASVGFAAVKQVTMLAPGVPAPATTPLWLRVPGEGTLLSAGSIQANDITDDDGTSIAAVSATGYDQGKLAAASARGFADRHGDRIASAEATQIDLDGLDRVFDTGRYTVDAASWSGLRPLIGHAEVSGLTTKGHHGSSGVDHVVIDGFAARPFALSPTGANTPTDAFRRDAAEAVALGSASLAGLTFSDAATQTHGSLGQLSLAGYQAGHLAHLDISDWSVGNPETATVTIGALQFSDFDASGLLSGSGGLAPLDWLAAAQTGAVKLGGMSLSKAAVQHDGQTVSLAALKESVGHGNPVETRFSVQQLSLPATISPSLQAVIDPLGIKTLVLDIDEAGRFDQKTGDSTIDHFTLAAEGLASLSLSGQFTNLPRQITEGADAMATLGKIGIGHATATFTNQSLVQKILAMMAKQSGRSLADVTGGARIAASFMAAAVVPDQPDAGQQIGAFIADPKTLTLTASPDTPVPVAGLLGPDLRASQTALKLHLSAN